ncbi:unnamed protein product [Caenorhabditis auriculariae]|uniref:Cytochrome P450 n=1 Tax=Caenorhabditis auriculariae TaxID=2777116 RepID=A0A8S1HA97_9PELO|nr:unnamed protein product [Caenorhabditis auriculariae]
MLTRSQREALAISRAARCDIGNYVGFYLWQWTYWWRRGVTGPWSYPVIGNSWTLLDLENPTPLQLREWSKKYGKVYGIQEGVRNVLVLSDPAMVQEVFVKQFDNFHGRKTNPLLFNSQNAPRIHVFNAEGNRWKRLRTISSPTFTNNNLKKIRQTVEDSALELLQHIEKHSNEPINFLSYFQEFTMDVIGRIAMGQTETKMFHNPLLEPLKKFFTGNERWKMVLLASAVPSAAKYIRSALLAFPAIAGNNFASLMKACETAVFDRIKLREKDAEKGIEPGEPTDFIDLFLDARADVHFEDNADFEKQSLKVLRQLTTDEIIAQCFVFLVAGFDTTALSLSYAAYLLATHPEAQKKLQKEIDDVLTTPSISFEELGNLKYMDAVIKETLRLYPLAALANSRRCMNPTILGGIPIEKDTFIWLDTWSIHRDTSVWGENAKDFVPERWLDAEVKNNAWIPFGHGPRQCIGMRLALMEEKLLLSHILRRYDLCVGAKTEIPLELYGTATIQPRSVHLYVKSR